MNEPCYSFRPNAFTPERTYRIGADALYWTSGANENHVAYSDVCEVRLSRRVMRGEAIGRHRATLRCHLRCRSGPRVTLSPLHYVRFRRWEDRSTPYAAFVGTLLRELRNYNPDLKVSGEVHWTLRLRHAFRHAHLAAAGWVGGKVMRLIREWDFDRTTRAAGRLMRAIGPRLHGHRVARANLKIAFPDKSDAEIEDLLRGVWDNLGRVMAEYAFLDRLYACDPLDPAQKRIVIEPATIERVRALRSAHQPLLVFAAHTANWELPPILATAFEVDFTAVYRPSDSQALNDLLGNARSRLVKTIAAQAGSARRIAGALRQGSSVAIFVDQHFAGGVDVLFFGRRCKMNPTPARLARQFDYPICGGRAVRLPDGRFRLELTDRLKLPREPDGKVNIAATTQMIAWTIEGWIREYPEQWFWLHRLWR
jgi:KDO2-lipid IV(A) lauroyltransferase